MLIPCVAIALLGAFVRRSFVRSIDAKGVSGSFGQRFLWSKLYYVDHVTKHTRVGGASHSIKDNQLELIFEGGKLIIPPMIHDREGIWDLINRLPVEVRDDGVVRLGARPTIDAEAVLIGRTAPREPMDKFAWSRRSRRLRS